MSREGNGRKDFANRSQVNNVVNIKVDLPGKEITELYTLQS
jgi:hypothetical protein